MADNAAEIALEDKRMETFITHLLARTVVFGNEELGMCREAIAATLGCLTKWCERRRDLLLKLNADARRARELFDARGGAPMTVGPVTFSAPEVQVLTTGAVVIAAVATAQYKESIRAAVGKILDQKAAEVVSEDLKRAGVHDEVFGEVAPPPEVDAKVAELSNTYRDGEMVYADKIISSQTLAANLAKKTFIPRDMTPPTAPDPEVEALSAIKEVQAMYAARAAQAAQAAQAAAPPDPADACVVS